MEIQNCKLSYKNCSTWVMNLPSAIKHLFVIQNWIQPLNLELLLEPIDEIIVSGINLFFNHLMKSENSTY